MDDKLAEIKERRAAEKALVLQCPLEGENFLWGCPQCWRNTISPTRPMTCETCKSKPPTDIDWLIAELESAREVLEGVRSRADYQENESPEVLAERLVRIWAVANNTLNAAAALSAKAGEE